MLKIFRHSSLLFKLCEPVQFRNTWLINNFTVKRVYDFNFFRNTTFSFVRHYSIANLEDTSKDTNPQSDEIDVKQITNGDPELEHKLKVLILEAEVMRQEGRDTPSNSFLKKHHWEELLKLPTRTARRKYLNFLFKLEKKKENIAMKREKKRLEKEQQPKPSIEPEDGQIIYSLKQNNIFLRFYDTTINHFFNAKLIEAMMFGQKLIIDCGYDKDMTTRENINCAKQLMLLFSDNRAHDDPYDLHFCNVTKDSQLTKAFHRQIPTMYEPWFPLNIYEKNYTDIFPKEKLIYLTPHCREEMLEYDHDAVYIIGAIVDKVNNEPLSLAKAKKEGLRMMKFPLDRYLQWGAGSGKNLTLNQVISVLLDVKKTGDWKYSLRHVPRRKIVDYSTSPNIDQGKTRSYEKNLDYKNVTWKNNVGRNRAPNRDQYSYSNSNNKRRYQIRSIFND